jgi:2-polyprenyl-6-methoxyphenol hydroxylase-like FAD-dependent oxidoreductase
VTAFTERTRPNLGQGAAQALEDAVLLGTMLGEPGEPEQVLRLYERRRARRANAVVRASRQAGRLAEVRSPLLAQLRDVALQAVPDRLALAQQRRIAGFRL